MTFQLAVFGNPIAHSRSPEIHRLFGELTGIQLTYDRILVPVDGFEETAGAFMSSGHGFNVTVPCKQAAYRWVEKRSERAELAQAVNTVYRDADGRIAGDTTDGRGLLQDLQVNLGWEIAGRKVLVLGAGGAVGSVLHDLMAEGPRSLHLWNRTHSRAVSLAERLPDAVTAVDTEALETGYDLIINGTSAGLSGDALSLPETLISAGTCCYDMVYSRQSTPFNAWCEAMGARTVKDGLGMLVEQAALAFEIWFGVRPETSGVIRQFRWE